MPILFLKLAKVEPEPTSVKNPILASGMANIVFSVAMRKGAKWLIPTPPPITIPSQLAISMDLHVASLQSRANYQRKNVQRAYRVALFSYRTFTSPPAQNALPPAPSIQKAGYFSSFGISFVKSLTICRFNEFNALGLFKITLGKPLPSTKSILLVGAFEEDELEYTSWVDRVKSRFDIGFIIGYYYGQRDQNAKNYHQTDHRYKTNHKLLQK